MSWLIDYIWGKCVHLWQFFKNYCFYTGLTEKAKLHPSLGLTLRPNLGKERHLEAQKKMFSAYSGNTFFSDTWQQCHFIWVTVVKELLMHSLPLYVTRRSIVLALRLFLQNMELTHSVIGRQRSRPSAQSASFICVSLEFASTSFAPAFSSASPLCYSDLTAQNFPDVSDPGAVAALIGVVGTCCYAQTHP